MPQKFVTDKVTRYKLSLMIGAGKEGRVGMVSVEAGPAAPKFQRYEIENPVEVLVTVSTVGPQMISFDNWKAA